MLNEEDIQKIAKPVTDNQEYINIFILSVIAKRLSELKNASTTDIQKLSQISKTNADLQKINLEISKFVKKQSDEIKNVIEKVAKDTYSDTKPFYKYRNIDFKSFNKNIEIKQAVDNISAQLQTDFKNTFKTQAFMIRDLKNPSVLKSTQLSEAYQSVINEAIQAASSGVDYNTVMQKTLKQLIDSGVRGVWYNTEKNKIYTQRLDTAVKRNLFDGIRYVSQEVQDKAGEQFGADGKEITVHAYPAPDHAPVQGHQFSNEEFLKMQTGRSFKDVQGKGYIGFPRAIGTLNCKHFTFSIVIGASPQNYSDEQLNDILKRNEKGYTLSNGKHLTMYECTQMQRKYETKIRRAKEGKIIAKQVKDNVLEKEYQAKVTKYTNEYKAFSNACGLKTRLENTYVKTVKV